MRAQMMIDDGQPRLLIEADGGALASWNATVRQGPAASRTKLVEAGDTIVVALPHGDATFDVREAHDDGQLSIHPSS